MHLCMTTVTYLIHIVNNKSCNIATMCALLIPYAGLYSRLSTKWGAFYYAFQGKSNIEVRIICRHDMGKYFCVMEVVVLLI